MARVYFFYCYSRRGLEDVRWLISLFGQGVGVAFGWAFLLFSVLAIPFSVVTLMGWFQLQWWVALIGVFVISLVPLVGRFVYLGLAVIGAYYFVAAGLSFHDAVGFFID